MKRVFVGTLCFAVCLSAAKTCVSAQVDAVRENWFEPNYDKSRIASCVLEDPLAFADGRKLKDPSEWPARRAEILRIFAENMFGREPPPAEKVLAEKIEEGETCGGFGVDREPLPDRPFPGDFDESCIGRDLACVRRPGWYGISAQDWVWAMDFAGGFLVGTNGGQEGRR